MFYTIVIGVFVLCLTVMMFTVPLSQTDMASTSPGGLERVSNENLVSMSNSGGMEKSSNLDNVVMMNHNPGGGQHHDLSKRDDITSKNKPTTTSMHQASSNGDIKLKSLPASAFAIVQFDTRRLLSISPNTAKHNDKSYNYWDVSAHWNQYYCDLHGHVYLYYSLRPYAKCIAKDGKELLADPWCKVHTMLKAFEEYPQIQVFLYMDSDAVLDERFQHVPLNDIVSTIQDKLSWPIMQKPIIFNQDGPCWWCNLVQRAGYDFCLNAGTVLYYRHQLSYQVLMDWWASALDPYEGNPIRRKFRLNWPWEQDRQMAIYNRSSEYIQIASQPEKHHMEMNAGHMDWCLSHLARSHCYVSHYCEGSYSKKRMKEIYLKSLHMRQAPLKAVQAHYL